MTEYDALYAACVAAPDDDLPRLVLADWLQEHGRWEEGELIRRMLADPNDAPDPDWHTRIDTGYEVEGRLNAAYGRPVTWCNTTTKFNELFVTVMDSPRLGVAGAVHLAVYPSAGLLDRVRADLLTLLKVLPRACKAWPVREVWADDCQPRMPRKGTWEWTPVFPFRDRRVRTRPDPGRGLLPLAVWQRLAAPRAYFGGTGWSKEYDSREAAVADLGQALLAIGRGKRFAPPAGEPVKEVPK